MKNSLRKKLTSRKRKSSKEKGSCRMSLQLKEYEHDKRKEIEKSAARIRTIDDERLEIENEIKNIQKSKQKDKNTDREVKYLNEKINELSREKLQATHNLLYFPYKLELKAKDADQEDGANFRRSTLRRNFVNLEICSNEGELSNRVDAEEDVSKTGSEVNLSVEEKLRYNKMFAELMNDEIAPEDKVVTFELRLDESPVESAISEEEWSTMPREEEHSDTKALLDSLEFNTKEILREDLKEKPYFETLCSMANEYKKFYVLTETLKHKLHELSTTAETKLDMPKDERAKLSEQSRKLVGEIEVLERHYRMLFEKSGLKEIETVILLPQKIRAYEKCYRFMETTELKRFIQLMARQTYLMKVSMEEKQE